MSRSIAHERRICAVSRLSLWITVAVTVLCGVLALAAPDDVLTTNRWLSRLYGFMSRLFPVIGEYTIRSNFPEVTGLYMSLMLLAFPFAFAAPLCTLSPDRRLLVPLQDAQRPGGISFGKYLLSGIVLGVLAPPLAYFALYANPGLDLAGIRLSSSRLQLALFGFCVTLVAPLLLGAAVHFYARIALGGRRTLMLPLERARAMMSFLRRLFARPQAASGDARPKWDPQQFVYVMIPGDIQPLARGERFEDPLEQALQAAGLGTISGGGSQLDDPYPDGRPRVAFCGIDIDVVDRDRALVAIRQKLAELGAPEGTEVHYTAGTSPLLDRFRNGAWQERLPRATKHPGFGV